MDYEFCVYRFIDFRVRDFGFIDFGIGDFEFMDFRIGDFGFTDFRFMFLCVLVKGMPYTGKVFCCTGHNVFN